MPFLAQPQVKIERLLKNINGKPKDLFTPKIYFYLSAIKVNKIH